MAIIQIKPDGMPWFHRWVRGKLKMLGLNATHAASWLNISETTYSTLLNHGTFTQEQKRMLREMINLNEREQRGKR